MCLWFYKPLLTCTLVQIVLNLWHEIWVDSTLNYTASTIIELVSMA